MLILVNVLALLLLLLLLLVLDLVGALSGGIRKAQLQL